MKILRMKATFGNLDEAELVLQPGLNDILLPNEQGKSTWAAFLLAMFYGIDTAQRASKDRIPEKLRYQPWNGKPMAGILEIELQNGSVLVLQRTSLRGKPMGELQVYEKETGLHLPEYTAENCGLKLLGVERSVFQRTAFLNGEELMVSRDGALSQRLENLAGGGDGEDSYEQAADRLKQWKNRIRYHKTGLLPEVEQRLQEVEQSIAQLEQSEHTRQVLRQSAELLNDRLRQAETAMRSAEEELAAAPRPQPLILWLWPAILLLVVCGVCIWGKSLWALLPGLAAMVMIPIAIKRKKSADQRRQELENRVRLAQADYKAAHAAQEKTAALQQELSQMPESDRKELMDQWAELEQRRQTLLEKEQAIAMAQTALEQAQLQQQRIYAPRLTGLAGEFLARLTGERYNGLLLEQDFSMEVLEQETGLTRPLAALSTGTQRQVWLALRLAMTELLLPGDVPIWLDDVLLTFDDHRTDLAMEVLSKTERQVILMRCK